LVRCYAMPALKPMSAESEAPGGGTPERV